MTIKTFISGFPRVGPNREYKWAVEKYWREEISEKELVEANLRFVVSVAKKYQGK